MTILHNYKYTLCMLFISAMLAFSTAGPVYALTVQVSPDNVAINLGYHGAKLQITGQSRAGDDLIIRITNANGDAHYKYIGKAGGLVWMKKGDISFQNVPGVYLLYSSRDLELLLDPAEQKANVIGFDALKETLEIETANEEFQQDKARWQDEFIRFKEKENLYITQTGTVTRKHGQKSDDYQVEVSWPYQAATGDYTVESIAVRNGKIVERATTNFTVERAGIVKKLTDLAFNRAALYGIMAVLIAMVAGFAVGLVFKKGGGAH